MRCRGRIGGTVAKVGTVYRDDIELAVHHMHLPKFQKDWSVDFVLNPGVLREEEARSIPVKKILVLTALQMRREGFEPSSPQLDFKSSNVVVLTIARKL